MRPSVGFLEQAMARLKIFLESADF